MLAASIQYSSSCTSSLLSRFSQSLFHVFFGMLSSLLTIRVQRTSIFFFFSISPKVPASCQLFSVCALLNGSSQKYIPNVDQVNDTALIPDQTDLICLEIRFSSICNRHAGHSLTVDRRCSKQDRQTATHIDSDTGIAPSAVVAAFSTHARITICWARSPLVFL